MQTAGMQSVDGRAYRGLVHALFTIVKQEGVLALWRGVGPTCARATVLAAAELATYDEFSAWMRKTGTLEQQVEYAWAWWVRRAFLCGVARTCRTTMLYSTNLVWARVPEFMCDHVAPSSVFLIASDSTLTPCRPLAHRSHRTYLRRRPSSGTLPRRWLRGSPGRSCRRLLTWSRAG